MNNKEFKHNIGYIVDIIVVITIAFVVTWTFFTRILMQGYSMSPNINNRDIVFVNRLYKNFMQLHRFDIIVFNINGKDSIKRIIGLPGDRIKISSSNIYINDILVENEFLSSSLSSYMDTNVYIGKDEYYVLGDNLDSSRDSRFEEIGNIHRSQIIGKVWKIVNSK